MIELWLVRHGTSSANVEKWVTGCKDVPLTEEGELQASSLGKWLSNHWGFEPDVYVTSTMKRAVDTADLLNIPSTPERYAELNETDAGDVSYWKRDDFDAKFPDFWSPFDENRPFPGGESHKDLYDRVIFCMQSIINKSPKNARILVVAHAGTISSIFHHAYNVPMKHFSKFVVDNGSLSVLRYIDYHTPPELVIYNQMPPDVEADI